MTKSHYPQKLLRKSRDAGYLKKSNIRLKEFYETKDVYKKAIPHILKQLNLDRFHTIYDFCGSHGFNIPYAIARNSAKYGVAVDIHPSKASKRLWSYYPRIAARMSYRQEDIYQNKYNLEDNSLVMAVHPCRGLAFRVCDIGIKNKLPVIISPCCIGKIDPFFAAFNNIKQYDKWCLTVAQKLVKADYNIRIRYIRPDTTPVNTIIIGIPKS